MKLNFKVKPKTVKKLITWAVILVLAAGGGVWAFSAGLLGGRKETAAAVQTSVVTRGPIRNTILQSGVVQPISKYNITSLAKGNVVRSDFDENSAVKKGDLLYQLDQTDAMTNIQKAELAIETQRVAMRENDESIAKLSVYAGASGTLQEFNVKAGGNIGTGTVGKIVDSSSFKVKIPFNVVDFRQISVGDRAEVTSALYMTTLSGTVTRLYVTPYGGTDNSGSMLNDVENTIDDSAAISAGVSLGGSVYTTAGKFTSAGSGQVEVGDITDVVPQAGGLVKAVYFKNGDKVKKGDKLLDLDGTSLYNSRTRSNISMENAQADYNNQRKKLEDYNITSPIDGVIITKTKKTGDTVNASSNADVLMVVADMSVMIFEITVDEKDIAKVELGQRVEVTADAIPGVTFEGEVTKIGNDGAASNGVTTYPVQIDINAPGALKPGMNVDGSIIVSEKSDVLLLPAEYVTKVGDRGIVFVKSGEGAAPAEGGAGRFRGGEGGAGQPAAGGDGQTRAFRRGGAAEGEAAPGGSSPPEGGTPGERPQRPEGEAAPAEGGEPSGAPASGTAGAGGFPGGRITLPSGVTAPDGYEPRMVALGMSDGSSYEIVSGLTQGQEVASATVRQSSGGGMMFMGGGAGGARPAGQGGGAAPQVRTR